MQCAVGLPLERAPLVYNTIECLLIRMVDHVKGLLRFKISRDRNKIERECGMITTSSGDSSRR